MVKISLYCLQIACFEWGAAILLSNRKCDEKIAKYELKHLIRTHLGSKDTSYNCVVQ